MPKFVNFNQAAVYDIMPRHHNQTTTTFNTQTLIAARSSKFDPRRNARPGSGFARVSTYGYTSQDEVGRPRLRVRLIPPVILMRPSRLGELRATVLREVSQPAVIAIYRLAISEAQRSPEVAAILNASRAANRNALAELLDRAQASGILVSNDLQRPTLTTYAFPQMGLRKSGPCGAV